MHIMDEEGKLGRYFRLNIIQGDNRVELNIYEII